MMILEGLIATKKGSDARRPIGGMPPAQQPSNQANPLDGALGQLFGRRAPSRKPHPSRPWPPKQPVRRSQPPPQPAPKPPPQKSLEEIDDGEEDDINSDDERVQEILPKMETVEEGEEDEDEEVPN